MTAPVTPIAPTPAAPTPAAPAAPAAPSGDVVVRGDRLAARNEIVSQFVDSAEPTPTPAAPDPTEGIDLNALPDDDAGDEQPDATKETHDDAPEADGDPSESADESGTKEQTAGPVKLRARNKDGEFVNIPDVKLEVTVGDKTYLKTPAELARMAVDGIAGQRFVAENQTLKQQVSEFVEAFPKIEQQYQALQQALAEQQALNLELLSSEDAYFTRRQEWAQMNSPEQVAARLRAENEALRQQQTQSTQQQLQVGYYKSHIQPAFEAALNAAPDVPNEMIYGKLALDTAKWNGPDGRVAPEHYPAFAEYIAGPFQQWVVGAQQKMTTAKAQADAAAKAEAAATARKKQAAVNASASGLTPAGSVPKTPAPSRDTPRDRASMKDAIKAGLFDSN